MNYWPVFEKEEQRFVIAEVCGVTELEAHQTGLVTQLFEGILYKFRFTGEIVQNGITVTHATLGNLAVGLLE